MIAVVGAETEKVGKEKAIADEEEKKVSKITEEVTRKQQDCERDLAKAEPALLAAKDALNTLNKVICFFNLLSIQKHSSYFHINIYFLYICSSLIFLFICDIPVH